MREDVRLVPLTRDALREHRPALIELDAEVRRELGSRYSTETWSDANFSQDLPGKFDLSYLALNETGAPCAFLVASVKAATAYIHRLAVKPGSRSKGIGTMLLRGVSKQAAARGLDQLALVVNRNNAAAIAFYRRIGFKDAVCPTSTGRSDHRRLQANSKTLAQI